MNLATEDIAPEGTRNRRHRGHTARVPALITRVQRPAAPDSVLAASAVEVARMLREKQITAVELVKRCYQRIDQVNPLINAVVLTCRERALAEAEEPTR